MREQLTGLGAAILGTTQQVFPRVRGAARFATTRPPRLDTSRLKVAMQEQADIYIKWWIDRYTRGLIYELPTLHEIKVTFQGNALVGEQTRAMCTSLLGMLVAARQRLTCEQ